MTDSSPPSAGPRSSHPSVLIAAVDTSAQSEAVIASAREMLQAMPLARLHVAHVVESIPTAAVVLGGAPMAVAGAGELLNEGRAFLEKMTARAAIEGRAEVKPHLLLGDPAEEIIKLADELEADLVIVGTHDPGAVERVLFGSISTKIARKAPCAVMVARVKRVTNAPVIEPVCPQCAKIREESKGEQMWCARHSEHHPRPHTWNEISDGFGQGSSTFRG